MHIKHLIIFILILSNTNLFAQTEDWFELENRKKNYPDSIYFSQYSEGLTKKEALAFAKTELAKSISSEITVSSSSLSKTENALLNDVFLESSTSKSSVTFAGLEEKHTLKKRTHYVFIYIEKAKLKLLTKSKYDDLLSSIKAEVNACQIMYDNQSYTEAKSSGDQISISVAKLKSLRSLLTTFGIDFDAEEINTIIENFTPLYAKIKEEISNEENYKYNKEQGDLKALSINYLDKEEAITAYKKSENINPERSLEDGIPTKIKMVSDELFKIYCQKALNFEEENKLHDAVNFYNKARNLFPGRDVINKQGTTTERIIICQDKLIDILISQGIEEFEDNPSIALGKFNDAKSLITSMSRNDRIKEINKLVKKAEKEVKKRKNKDDRELRRGRVKTQRDKSPHRILFSVGGGFQNEYTDHSDIFSNPINVDIDKWHISSTLGYRLNLPTEIITSKSGFEKSKGNVLAVFYKQGNTLTNYTDGSGETKTAFSEFEFGYIFKERIRVSLGKGNRSFSANNSELLPPSSYNCATASWYMHFGRLSVEPSITYLLNEKLAFEQAKFNASFSLRFYLYKKIYKTTKDQIQ
jgi:hypothetical protein